MQVFERSEHGGGDIGYTNGIGGYSFGYSLLCSCRGSHHLYERCLVHFLGFASCCSEVIVHAKSFVLLEESKLIEAEKRIEGFLIGDVAAAIFVKFREDLIVAFFVHRVFSRLLSAFGSRERQLGLSSRLLDLSFDLDGLGAECENEGSGEEFVHGDLCLFF